jgi:hypothetical protein
VKAFCADYGWNGADQPLPLVLDDGSASQTMPTAGKLAAVRA